MFQLSRSDSGKISEKTMHTHEPYISGYKNNKVKPDGSITRAEFAAILFRTQGGTSGGTCKYSDVSSYAWYYDYVAWTAAEGIMTGYPNGKFKPNGKLTRAEFASSIARLKKLVPIVSTFADAYNHWADSQIGAVQFAAYMKGYDDCTFRPWLNITRAEVTSAMNRMLGRSPNKDEIMAKTTNPYTDLPTDHWGYADIMEASVKHDYTLYINEVWEPNTVL